MTERPILFTDPMPQALLREVDPKTQTRRDVRPQPKGEFLGLLERPIASMNEPPVLRAWFQAGAGEQSSQEITCPYGKPGDRLWVKETFWAFGRWETRFSQKKGRDEWHFVDLTHTTQLGYRFERPGESGIGKDRKVSTILPAWWKRPSIFMPRVASRILLEVTELRVERLQDISEADAIAEGIENNPKLDPAGVCHWRVYDKPHTGTNSPVASYQSLWESINGAGSWALNPWVWVVAFRRMEVNSGST